MDARDFCELHGGRFALRGQLAGVSCGQCGAARADGAIGVPVPEGAAPASRGGVGEVGLAGGARRRARLGGSSDAGGVRHLRGRTQGGALDVVLIGRIPRLRTLFARWQGLVLCARLDRLRDGLSVEADGDGLPVPSRRNAGGLSCATEG